MRKSKLGLFTLLTVLSSAFVIFSSFAFAADDLPEKRSFFSQALGAEKNYRLYLPPSYETSADRRYPVVYLLHGYNFARNNPQAAPEHEEENHWGIQERLRPIADCLFTVNGYDGLLKCLTDRGVEHPEAVVNNMRDEYPVAALPLPEMIVVMPDGDSSFYVDRPDGLPQWPPLDGPEFVDGVRKGATGQYETYIARDLVAHVDSTFRTIADRDHRGIGGFSMGGIGSLNMTLGRPDTFCCVASMSAIYTLTKYFSNPLTLSSMKKTTPELILLVAKNPQSSAPKLDKEKIKPFDPMYRLSTLERTDVSIYYDAGAQDYFSGWRNFQALDEFEKALVAKGLKSYPSKHVIPASEINGKGMHTGRYWRSRLGVALGFFAEVFD